MDARLNIDFGRVSLLPTATTDPELLVAEHLDLVRRIALQVHWRFSSAIEVEDLIQFGRIALIEAARNFEDRGQATFGTYAAMRVRGAMIDQLRKSAFITRSAMRRRREYRAVRSSLQGELCRPPTDAEMAARVDLSLKNYHEVIRADGDVHHESLDHAYSEYHSGFKDQSPDAFEELSSTRRRSAIAAAVSSLPNREAVILQLFFVEEMSLDAIGEVLSVSAPRVCQIKKRALDRVRKKLTGWTDTL